MDTIKYDNLEINKDEMIRLIKKYGSNNIFINGEKIKNIDFTVFDNIFTPDILSYNEIDKNFNKKIRKERGYYNRFVEFNGEIKRISEFSKELNIPRKYLFNRLELSGISKENTFKKYKNIKKLDKGGIYIGQDFEKYIYVGNLNGFHIQKHRENSRNHIYQEGFEKIFNNLRYIIKFNSQSCIDINYYIGIFESPNYSASPPYVIKEIKTEKIGLINKIGEILVKDVYFKGGWKGEELSLNFQ